MELADGRIMSIMRFNGSPRLPQPFSTYQSYSEDKGLTWSDPVANNLQVETPSLDIAPCTENLPEGRSKLLFGYRDRAQVPSGIAAATVSYDNGATWDDNPLVFEEPGGAPFGTFTSAEPDFLRLEDSRMLVVFQTRVGSEPFKIAYNVIEDAGAEECRDLFKDAEAEAEEELAIHLQREDRDVWPFGLARDQETFAATDVVGDVIPAAAKAVTCNSSRVQLLLEGRPLDREMTLRDAGVRNGDTLTVRAVGNRTRQAVSGLIDLDAFPQSRHTYAWSDSCDYSVAFDMLDRSIGFRLETPSGAVVDEVSLRDSDGDTRLTAQDYSVWVSDDNDSYREVNGWTLDERIGADGRLVHTFNFRGLNVDQPYLKIHQAFGDTARTFVIRSMQRDATVSFRPL